MSQSTNQSIRPVQSEAALRRYKISNLPRFQNGILTLRRIPLHTVLRRQLSKVRRDDRLILAVRQQTLIGRSAEILLTMRRESLMNASRRLTRNDSGRSDRREESKTRKVL